jgi:hypothetical protein
MKTMPGVSLEYVPVTITATVAGQPYNPTADVVEMAFTPASTSTQPVTWYTGSWDSTDPVPGTSSYTALCLIGPGGTTTLTAGTWQVWVRITDSPEQPVIPAGQLRIT